MTCISGADPGFSGERFTAWVRMRANIAMGPHPFSDNHTHKRQQVRLHGDKLLENSTFQVVLVQNV